MRRRPTLTAWGEELAAALARQVGAGADVYTRVVVELYRRGREAFADRPDVALYTRGVTGGRTLLVADVDHPALRGAGVEPFAVLGSGEAERAQERAIDLRRVVRAVEQGSSVTSAVAVVSVGKHGAVGWRMAGTKGADVAGLYLEERDGLPIVTRSFDELVAMYGLDVPPADHDPDDPLTALAREAERASRKRTDGA